MPDKFKERRNRLGLSQAKLARLSGVSRFKICTAELGDTTLPPEDQEKIQQALQAEAARLHEVVSALVA